MSNQIADLEIKIGVNDTELRETPGRVQRALEKQEYDARRFAKVRQNLMDRIEARQKEKYQRAVEEAKNFQKEVISAEKQAFSNLQEKMDDVIDSHTRSFAVFKREIEQMKAPELKPDNDLSHQYSIQLDYLEKQKAALSEIISLRHKIDQSFKDGALTSKDNAALQLKSIGISKEIERAENSATQAKQQFINKLKEQVTQQNLSRTEMLRVQAAQLGVSSSADIYIRKLEKQNSVMKGVTLTSGQYRQAMRQLPMQMTDIVTSLASGMPPWLVAVQQGGQIKDSFGGFGNSLKAITSLITPWKLAMAGGAGAIAAFGIATYQGSKELSEYNKQLILTGNYAAKTKGQLNDLAKSLSGDGITQYKMADALAQVVGSGSFTGAQVDMVASVAAKMEKATGQSVDETIKQFQRLKDQPVQAVVELDKSIHFLTATQLEQISTLQDQGKEQEAAAVAMESFANAMQVRTKQIVDNLGYLESAWEDVKNMAKKAWDSMLDLGREGSIEDEIKQLEDYISRFDGSIYTLGMNENKQRLAQLKFKQLRQGIEGTLTNSFNKINEDSKKQILADQKLKREYESAEERHQRRLSEIKNSGGSQKEIDRALKLEAIKYKKELARETPKTPKGKAYRPDLGVRQDESSQAELTSLQAQLKLLQQHASATDFISQQRKNFQLEQAKFSVLEEASKKRKLSLDEQSLLKNKESILANKKALADVGDQVSRQEHLNKLSDQADKYAKQQEARQRAITESLGLSSRELQRALEIEQLRSTYGGEPQWAQVQASKMETFKQEDAARQDWFAGMKTAWGDYRDSALDANAQIQNVTSATLNGFSSQLAETLIGGEANFRDFAKSILKMLTEIALKMAIVKGFEAFGFGGGSVVANANGGVYNTPGLSAYSGQIVSKPTLFPFARGAGLMGEAGPEAILPLRRGIDGKLGVVAANANKNAGGFYQTNHITIQNDGSNGEIGPQALKTVYDIAKKGAEDYVRTQRRDGGSF
ncbi:TPA: phage tail tape measure protein [Providencia alcalifaciens]